MVWNLSPLRRTTIYPPLPSLRIQRAVERKLAEREMWLTAGHVLMERYRQRQPHALMSLSRMARLLQIGFAFKKLALGLDSPNRVPDKIVYDYELTGLKRGYGHLLDPAPSAAAATVPASPVVPPAPPSSSALPAENDRRAVPVSPPSGLSRPEYHRSDAWSRLARQLRQRRG